MCKISETTMKSVRKDSLDIQVFTRITKDMDALLGKIAEDQERTKSFVLRKALKMYLSANSNLEN